MKVMPSIYMHRASRSIADLNMLDDGRVLITRINVPIRSRGNGIGSMILQEIIKDADELGVTLLLEPVPSGGLTYDELVEWYSRYGFNWITFEKHSLMERQPGDEIGYIKDPSVERAGFANFIRGLSSTGS